MAAAYQDIFHDDVCAALDVEIARMDSTRAHVKAACETVDRVAYDLSDLGTRDAADEHSTQRFRAQDDIGGIGILPLLEHERAGVLNQDAITRAFESYLAKLLAQAGGTAAPPTACRGVDGVAMTESSPAATSQPLSVVTLGQQQRRQRQQCDKHLCGPCTPASWHQDVGLFLEVASYLSSDEVLLHVENVSARWQRWLYEPSVSRHFWLACMQREFPAQLHTLLLNSKTVLSEMVLEGDWRTMVMMCVTAADEALSERSGSGGDIEDES